MDGQGQPGLRGSSAAVALGSSASLGYRCVVGFQVCLCGGPESPLQCLEGAETCQVLDACTALCSADLQHALKRKVS